MIVDRIMERELEKMILSNMILSKKKHPKRCEKEFRQNDCRQNHGEGVEKMILSNMILSEKRHLKRCGK